MAHDDATFPRLLQVSRTKRARLPRFSSKPDLSQKTCQHAPPLFVHRIQVKSATTRRKPRVRPMFLAAFSQPLCDGYMSHTQLIGDFLTINLASEHFVGWLGAYTLRCGFVGPEFVASPLSNRLCEKGAFAAKQSS